MVGHSINVRAPFYLVVAAGLALLVLLPSVPSMQPVPARDSGVFLYTADRMISGDLPYADVWDHKGPVIYFIDALGLVVGFGTRWGVWLLELASMTTAFGFSMAFFTRRFNPLLGIVVTGTSSLVLWPLLQRGNLTEEYALPLQFLALYLMLSKRVAREQRWKPFVFGLAAGLALLLRPNSVGVWAAILVAIWLSRDISARDRLRRTLWPLLGVLLTVAPVALWLLLTGAGPRFVDAYITYNNVYSNFGPAERVTNLINELEELSDLTLQGWVVLGLGGWAVAAGYLITGATSAKRLLATVVVVGVPLELLLASWSGRQYPHYYMTLIPVFSLGTALLLDFAVRLMAAGTARSGSPTVKAWLTERIGVALTLLTLVIVVPLFTINARVNYVAMKSRWHKGDNRTAIGAYIAEHSGSDDTVLMWGAESTFNFLADRRSPTRYVYQYPLLYDGYASRTRTAEFVSGIIQDPPRLIVDTSVTNRQIPPLDAATRSEWTPTSVHFQDQVELQGFYEFVRHRYVLTETLQPTGWRVYARRE